MPTTAIAPYLDQLAKLKTQAEFEAYRIINELEPLILDYVRERQLFDKGIDGKGNKLKAYTPYTIALKKQKGQVTNRTTLQDTGDFYNDFYLIAKNKELDIFSSNEKTTELTEKYGDDIFLMTVDHEKQFNQELLTRLVEWLLNSIHI